jgi:hypothetical protein
MKLRPPSVVAGRGDARLTDYAVYLPAESVAILQ